MFSFIFMALFVIESINGMGMHQVDIPRRVQKEQLKVSLPRISPNKRHKKRKKRKRKKITKGKKKAFYFTIPFYNSAVLCAKASILLQYHRVFPTPSMRITCKIFLAILATYGTWAVASGFLNCIPVARFWDPNVPGYCLDMKALWFSNASMHILTDLAILIIPIPALKGLGLPLRQRVGVIGIFALGGLYVFFFSLVFRFCPLGVWVADGGDGISVCITSIIRLTSLKRIADSTDPTCKYPLTPTNSQIRQHNQYPVNRRQPRRSLLVRNRMQHRHNLRLPPNLATLNLQILSGFPLIN